MHARHRNVKNEGFTEGKNRTLPPTGVNQLLRMSAQNSSMITVSTKPKEKINKI